MLRIKFLRLSRGLTQDQVAEFTGIPRPHYSQIENGIRNARPTQLDALARFFNVPAGALFEVVRETGVTSV